MKIKPCPEIVANLMASLFVWLTLVPIPASADESASNTVTVTTLAGGAGQAGSNDGAGTSARFNQPCGVALDGGGNLYVADWRNNTIRKITPDGVVTTLAGSASTKGSDDGTGDTARFNYPSGVAVDGSGNIYVADQGNAIIRKIAPGGVVTTLAGSANNKGSNDGTGNAAQFGSPVSVAVDGTGNVFVADKGNHTIRKITPDGVVTTLAGSPGQFGSTDGTGSAARFKNPASVAVDGNDNVYVADCGNQTIRKISPTGVVTTLAGAAGQSGSSDGTGNAALFNNPFGVAVESSGNVYVAEADSHAIRKITPDGVVTTLAGNADTKGSNDGTGSVARFGNPVGVAVDSTGNVYVADSNNDNIRKISSGGVTATASSTASPASTSGTTNSANPAPTPENPQVASLRAKATAGDAQAAYDLGSMYLTGTGVPQDAAEGFKWCQKAADAGNVDGEKAVGSGYRSGVGVARDLAQALTWYRKAADQGDADAQFAYGDMYSDGEGVEVDWDRASYWWKKAADQGNPRAEIALGTMCRLPVPGIQPDYYQALSLYRKAADQGDPQGQMAVGLMYSQGLGVPQDSKEAMTWWLKAAAQDNPDAEGCIGNAYLNGDGVPQDYAQALSWLQKVGDRNAGTLFNLGSIYENGWGVPKNAPKAVEYYKKAAKGDPTNYGAKVKQALDRLGVDDSQ